MASRRVVGSLGPVTTRRCPPHQARNLRRGSRSAATDPARSKKRLKRNRQNGPKARRLSSSPPFRPRRPLGIRLGSVPVTLFRHGLWPQYPSAGGRDMWAHAYALDMTVQYEANDRVATVSIDRPEVKNAVDAPTAQALFEAFERFESDDEVDVAILTGTGDTFCAGADLKAIAEGRGNRVTELAAAEIVGSLGPMGPTRRAPAKPVIAAIEGHAVAGGLELALWCDLRVAAENSVLGVFCRRFGVPLIDGGTVRLPRLIGHSRAMDLILTGRAVEGPEALQMGLVNRLTPPGAALTEAFQLARSLSEFPQRCLRSDRLSALAQWDMGVDDALASEVVHGMATIRSGETRTGASTFTKGRGRHGAF